MPGSPVEDRAGRSATVDIIVPVYNEAAFIDELYARMERLGLERSLIFVDNASTDNTPQLLKRFEGLRVIRHDRNEGYGASIRDGIAAAAGELIIIIDGDLEYPPEAIPAMVAALEAFPVVYGSRFLGQRPPEMGWLRRVGNRFVTTTYNVLFGQSTTDFYTGMKGLRRSAFPLHQLRRSGFEHVIELGAMVAVNGATIHEVAIDYAPRSRGESKMRHVSETLKFVAYVLGYWLRCVVLRRPVS